ncbi:late protein H7 [Finch poxvirus]|uniref:Late protein H7 n=2 Tax=unclassified Avipoxvirus TaxID=336487 RepID=A0AAT9UQI7_9POXV|nr:late protein H7 [Finch poxvirus]UOX38995.1 late protein H7 [Finch poxvirus]
MDSKACILLDSVFKGILSTKDIYVIIKHVFNTVPKETIFSKTDNNEVFIDFVYEDGTLASSYLGKNTSRVEDYLKVRNIVAEELTNLAFIDNDLDGYIKHSDNIRKFMRLYRCSNAEKKAKNLKSTKKRLKDKGIDDREYEFIKDAICLLNHK